MSSPDRPDGYAHIIVDEDYNFGQPTMDSGFTVPQVVQLLENDYSVEDITDRLGAPQSEVTEAVRYYEEHTQEINNILEDIERTVDEYADNS